MPQANISLETAVQRHEGEAAAAERAFAIRVAYDGIRDGFLSVLADDAVICGEGPIPGRAFYEALPKDYAGRLMWEPILVLASTDGTLAVTSGPYRLMDGAGLEKSNGTYFSVWRRHAAGHYELVLDFGAKGAGFPEVSIETKAPAGGALTAIFEEAMKTGHSPSRKGATVLGETEAGTTWAPMGFHVSRDQELGVLWGSRRRADNSLGAFAIVFQPGAAEPLPVLSLHA
jgi:hypothetical protein